MAERLYLVVAKEKKVIESVEVAWSSKWIDKIIPKKKEPIRPEVGMKMWEIAASARRQFVNFAIKEMDKLTPLDDEGKTEDKAAATQNLYGYFNLMGVSHRWIGNLSVEWMLALSHREMLAGEII